ncbi:MAG: phosphoribosylformylglycinamidine synthase subunit PurQ, partial [Candidatus Omnitrophota bacterium]
MVKTKVVIIRTAGTNCDKETLFAFQTVKAEAELLHINLLRRKKKLSDYQIICLPGGFSYGDDLGAGKILSLELKLWFRDSLVSFLEKGGLILGICNGFQVLVKTGILPDLDFSQKVTLTVNDSGRFEDRWTFLKSNTLDSDLGGKKILPAARNIWSKGLPDYINLPVAHGEGK